MNVQTIKNALKNKKTLVASAVALTIASGAAVAAGAGAPSATAGAFNNILTEIYGWLSGAPGKILATLAFGFAMFNVVQQNFAAAAGAFLGALLMAFGEDIIDTMFTAGI